MLFLIVSENFEMDLCLSDYEATPFQLDRMIVTMKLCIQMPVHIVLTFM